MLVVMVPGALTKGSPSSTASPLASYVAFACTGSMTSPFATSFSGAGLALATTTTTLICNNFVGFTKGQIGAYPLGFGSNNILTESPYVGLLTANLVESYRLVSAGLEI